MPSGVTNPIPKTPSPTWKVPPRLRKTFGFLKFSPLRSSGTNVATARSLGPSSDGQAARMWIPTYMDFGMPGAAPQVDQTSANQMVTCGVELLSTNPGGSGTDYRTFGTGMKALSPAGHALRICRYSEIGASMQTGNDPASATNVDPSQWYYNYYLLTTDPSATFPATDVQGFQNGSGGIWLMKNWLPNYRAQVLAFWAATVPGGTVSGNHYDGFEMDVMGRVPVDGGNLAGAWNPGNIYYDTSLNQAASASGFTVSQWMDLMEQFGGYMAQNTQLIDGDWPFIMINGVGNSAKYFGDSTHIGCIHITDLLIGQFSDAVYGAGHCENFLRSDNASVSGWPTNDAGTTPGSGSFQDSINMILDANLHKQPVLFGTKLWCTNGSGAGFDASTGSPTSGFASVAESAQWFGYAWASFLLGTDTRHMMNYRDDSITKPYSTTTALGSIYITQAGRQNQLPNNYKLGGPAGDTWLAHLGGLGAPLETFTGNIKNAELTSTVGYYRRLFTNGIVYINPNSSTTGNITIPSSPAGSYTGLDGTAYNSGSVITIAAHTGLVLTFQSPTFAQQLTASLSFTGSMSKSISKNLVAGGLSFTGSLKRAVTKNLASASLGFTGSMSKAIAKAQTASLSFTGGMSKAIAKGQSASLSFTGSMQRATSKTLTPAALSFAGTLVSGRQFFRTLTANLSFTGSISKAISTKLPVANLSFTGSMSKGFGKGLTASLSFIGRFNKSFVAGVPIAGSVAQTGTTTVSPTFASPTVAGHAVVLVAAAQSAAGFPNAFTLSGVYVGGATGWQFIGGTQTTRTRIEFWWKPNCVASELAPTVNCANGTTFRAVLLEIPGVGLDFSAVDAQGYNIDTVPTSLAVTTTTNTTLPYGIAIAGFGHRITSATGTWSGNPYANSVNFETATVMHFAVDYLQNPPVGTTTTDTGTDTGPTSVTWVGGVVVFRPNLIPTFLQSLTASLSFAGSMAKSIATNLTSNLTFTGSLKRAISTTLPAAALSFSASPLAKAITKKFSASNLSFTGSMQRAIAKNLPAGLSFNGSIGKTFVKTLTSSLSFTGSMSKAISTKLSSNLSFTGSLKRGVAKNLAGASLSFNASPLVRGFSKTLTATLSFNASPLKKTIGKGLIASLGFIGAISTIVNRTGKAVYTIDVLTPPEYDARAIPLAYAIRIRSIKYDQRVRPIDYEADATSIEYAISVTQER